MDECTVLISSNGGNGSVIVQYVILPSSNNLLTNGGFEAGFSPWEFQNYPDLATATVTSNSGEYTEGTHGLRVNISSLDQYWSIQVRQSFSATAQQHTLTFWAKAQSQRTIIVDAQDRNTWTNLGLWQEPVITTSWQQYSYTFTIPAGYPTGWIHFYLGAASQTVWLDDVKLIAGLGKAIPQEQEKETATVLPAFYALYQNHPNPFNPTTTFRFDLPEASQVKLAVHNIVGQEVAIVNSGHWMAGCHSIVWDASALPSGVYFYTLEAGKFRAMRKFLLLK
ncbi:MAG: carbohydrate binding domain-containing protein [Patescibacteria group bacterium]